MAEKRTVNKNRTPERPKNRIPLSGSDRNIMVIEDMDPNYQYRWVNDKPGRIERFKRAGYEFVSGNSKVREGKVDAANSADSLLTMQVGEHVTAYAMRIKKEWHEEDKAAKEKAVEATEESLFRSLNDEEKGNSHYGKVVLERK